MRRLILSCLALAVAGCTRDDAPPAANQAADAEEIVIAETDTPPPQGEAAAGPAAAPRAESIPAKFRGIWAEGRAACAQLSHSSRLIISANVIRYPSFVLVGESIQLPAESSFAVKGQSQRTGAPAEAHFSIDATGNLLTDEAGGGAVRVRCG